MKSTEAPLPNLCSRIAGSAIPKVRSLALVRIGTVEVEILPTQIGRQRTARSNDETPIRAYASQLVAYLQTDPLRLTSQTPRHAPAPNLQLQQHRRQVLVVPNLRHRLDHPIPVLPGLSPCFLYVVLSRAVASPEYTRSSLSNGAKRMNATSIL